MTKSAREDRGVEKRGNHPVQAGHAENWPNLIFEKLRQFEVRHVAYVPDAGLAQLIELCEAADGMEPTVLTTEEEGIAILAALGWAESAASFSCRAAASAIASILSRS